MSSQGLRRARQFALNYGARRLILNPCSRGWHVPKVTTVLYWPVWLDLAKLNNELAVIIAVHFACAS